MNISFKGKVVFVTGAGSGMGLAAAKAFAEAGASVALVDFNFKAVEDVAKSITAAHKPASLPVKALLSMEARQFHEKTNQKTLHRSSCTQYN